MSNDKLRRQIIFEAARLMYTRQETEYYQAKRKASRRLSRTRIKPADLPSNAEIRDEIQRFTYLYEGDARFDNLREMRLSAWNMLRLLRAYKPRLIGSVLTGHVRHGSDIDIHVFSSSIAAVTQTLDDAGLFYDVEHKHVRKDGEERLYTHIHVHDRFPIELTCYAADQAHVVMRSSITGKPMERASLAELEQLLREAYPDLDLDEEPSQVEIEGQLDRFQVYRMLLLPLEKVVQGRQHHPEGDALYHSLQVFELARGLEPYDEEFLLAALLHDVGKAIDPFDHVTTGLEALEGFITPRTEWLIEQHMEAHKVLDGSIGARSRRRLQQHPDYELLMVLCRCDRDGRVAGAIVPDLDEALEHIRDVVRLCDG